MSWACVVCTFDNPSASSQCEMCESPRPGASGPPCSTNGCTRKVDQPCDKCSKALCLTCSHSHKCGEEPVVVAPRAAPPPPPPPPPPVLASPSASSSPPPAPPPPASPASPAGSEIKVNNSAPPPPEVKPELLRSNSVEREDFECRVCQELMVDPCTLHCGHTCCRHCLFKWLKASKENAKCPAGCATLISRKLPKVSIVLRSRIQKIFPKEYEARLAAIDSSLGDEKDEYRKLDDDCDTQVASSAQSEDGSLRLLEALLGLQRRVESRHCSHCRGEAGLCACKNGCALKLTSACIAVHDFECSGCHTAPVTGKLYLCSRCDGYGLCGNCYADLKHDLDHDFLQLDTRGAPPKRLGPRQPYPVSIEVKGAGSQEANGVYFRTSETMAGTPKYCMERAADGFTKVYHICKSRSTRTQTIKWWICRTDRAGDRLNSEKDIDFYTCESDSLLPPLTGWQVLLGAEPVPNLHLPEGTEEAKQPGLGRLQLGDSVMLSENYLSCSDASSGPLQPGSIGVIWNDAHDIKPYQVEVDGTKHKWWYSEGALQKATAPWSEEKKAEARKAADYRKKLGLVDQILVDEDIPEHAKSLLVDEILRLAPGETSPMFSETERGFQIHMGAVLAKAPEERHAFLLKRIRQDADYSDEEKAFLCEDVTSGRHEAVVEKPDGWTINRAALQKIMRERGLPIGRSRVIMHCEHCAGHKATCSCTHECPKPEGTQCFPAASGDLLSRLLHIMGSSSSGTPSSAPERSGPTITVADSDDEVPSLPGSPRAQDGPPDLGDLKSWSVEKLKAFLTQQIERCTDPNTLRRAVWDWECAAPAGPRLQGVARVAGIDPQGEELELRAKLRASFKPEEGKNDSSISHSATTALSTTSTATTSSSTTSTADSGGGDAGVLDDVD